MHILLNAVAASAGGGITYVKNVVPHLAKHSRVTVLLPPHFEGLDERCGARVIKFPGSGNSAVRFRREQQEIPRIIRRENADVLISAGNFAVRNSPVPQILLSRNSLYTSEDFCRDLRQRGEFAMWLDTKLKGALAMKSVSWADVTVAPTEAFARELRLRTGRSVEAIYHGFDHERFLSRSQSFPLALTEKIEASAGCVRLLLVSYYNYYRNFETLLRGLAVLKRQSPQRRFKLFLTCKLSSAENPGRYRAEGAAKLVRDLGLNGDIVELGAVPYEQLAELYRSCDLYVTAAYAESFAQPLVEAMASGLPVIASNIAVHREICGSAGTFFERFNPHHLASTILKVIGSSGAAARMATQGRHRALDFSWARHVRALVELANSLLEHTSLGSCATLTA